MSDDRSGSAVVVGVGPGLGAALVRRCASEGLQVYMTARSPAHLDRVRESLGALAGHVHAVPCDATDEAAIEEVVARASVPHGAPVLAVYNAGAYQPREIMEIETEEFEQCWRVGCFGGFLLARAAARRMTACGSGTILLTGATASLRGGARFANLAVGKFGLRALAQSLAREIGPKGVHVAHVIIDGMIHSERYAHLAADRPSDALLDPDAIADAYWQLHAQHRSAWTLELDVRPWVEKF